MTLVERVNENRVEILLPRFRRHGILSASTFKNFLGINYFAWKDERDRRNKFYRENFLDEILLVWKLRNCFRGNVKKNGLFGRANKNYKEMSLEFKSLKSLKFGFDNLEILFEERFFLRGMILLRNEGKLEIIFQFS